MKVSLYRSPSFEATLSLGAMVLAAVLFLVSAAAFIVLVFTALISLVMPIAGWHFLPFTIWAWAGLWIAIWHVVKAIELINTPDWKELGWAAMRSMLITAACPIIWPALFGMIR